MSQNVNSNPPIKGDHYVGLFYSLFNNTIKYGIEKAIKIFNEELIKRMPRIKKKDLPKHVQQSPRGSRKRFVKYATGSEETKRKMIEKSKKKSNVLNTGRILEGPKGGQFTPSGRKKKE